MKKYYLLPLLLIVFTFTSSASLHFSSCAPLKAHLLEVNKEWANMWPDYPANADYLAFDSEAERIALHLSLVSRKLYDVNNSMKNELLCILNEYSKKGVFPINTVLPYRNPVFIDEHNTACAVGHLMRESGYAELASSIDKSMELHYINNMRDSRIDDWATVTGFTKQELAWIQPGYPPNTIWNAPGGGVSDEVTAMITATDGSIVLAGNFDLGAGSNGVVASWNGTSYTQLGNTLGGEITDIIEFNGEYYVSGAFYQLNAFYDHARFDGQNWVMGVALPGLPVSGNDLHEHAGELYLAGEGSGIAGASYLVSALQGTNWNLIGTALNDEVLTMASHNNTLHIGGKFTATQGGQNAQHVAFLDSTGNWQPVLAGLDGVVHDLESYQGSLYAAGDLGTMQVPAFGLASLNSIDTAWVPMLPGHEFWAIPFNGKNEIRDIEFVAYQLFAAGSFEIQQLLGTFGQNLMWVDYVAGNGNALAQATSNGEVNCITNGIGSSIYIGGAFDSLNYQNTPHLAWSDITVGISSEKAQSALKVWPVPSNGTLNIQISDQSKAGLIEVSDLSGKLVSSIMATIGTTTTSLKLAPGTYFLRLQNEAQSTRIVVN